MNKSHYHASQDLESLLEFLSISWNPTMHLVSISWVVAELIMLQWIAGISSFSTIETKLVEDLLANVTAVGRPVLSNNEPVHVTFDLKLHKIEKLLTREQHLITHTFVVMRWADPRMRWDPSKYNGTKLVNLGSSFVWTPDIVLYNTADLNNNAPADFYKSPLHVYSNGTITWFSTVVWQSSCAVDITWFPVDSQTCSLVFGSLSYSKHRMTLSFHKLPESFANLRSKHHVTNGEWDVLSLTAKTNEHHYDCCDAPVSQVVYTFILKRRPLYFFLYLIFPIIAVVLLSMLIFKIPADAGERIGFAVTILLTMGVYLMVIAQDLPRKGDSAPLVGILYVTLFYIMVLGCVTGIMTARMAFKVTSPPEWLRRLVIKLTKKSSKKIGALKASFNDHPIQDMHSVNEELTDFTESEHDNDMNKNRSQQLRKEKSDQISMTILRQRRSLHLGVAALAQDFTQVEADNQKQWQEIAFFLDRMFFWGYLGTIVIASCSVLLGLEVKYVQSA
ncbi:neuronal acetylcholine receptor subunit alpha-10-like isoform X1 [Rhopilema esculentum]|uniref:neuronal acetylcholine receptor subunit alpha-10-like isoform X1 n=2 Tax=Rhopilema esculentum TaxID=499914 RepID=UPI0031CFD52B